VLNPGRQILAFIGVTGTAITVVDAFSRTAIVRAFDYPGGAVLIYGLSMTLVWLMHHVVQFSFSPGYYRLQPFEIDGGPRREHRTPLLTVGTPAITAAELPKRSP